MNLRNRVAPRSRNATPRADLDDYNATQKRMIEVTLSKKRFVDTGKIEKEISKWEFPMSFLDFETIAFAISRFDGVRAYQQIPFQFSCHVKSTEKSNLKHVEYLHQEMSRIPLVFEFVCLSWGASLKQLCVVFSLSIFLIRSSWFSALNPRTLLMLCYGRSELGPLWAKRRWTGTTCYGPIRFVDPFWFYWNFFDTTIWGDPKHAFYEILFYLEVRT